MKINLSVLAPVMAFFIIFTIADATMEGLYNMTNGLYNTTVSLPEYIDIISSGPDLQNSDLYYILIFLILLAVIVFYIIFAFNISPRDKRYHIIFFVILIFFVLWFTGGISQLGEWKDVHKEEIWQALKAIFLIIVFAVILYFIIKYWKEISILIRKYWPAILKNSIVIFIVSKIKFILSIIIIFVKTSFGFIFSISYGLSLIAIEMNPELIQHIYQMPSYILSGAISLAVATILSAIYNNFNPRKQYHSMGCSNQETYIYSYLDIPYAKGPAKVEWKWYSPDGEKYQEISLEIKPEEKVTCWCPIQIAGTKAANLEGNWHVDIFLDGRKIQSDIFFVFKNT